MSWRVPLALCALFALPFLASDPGYVWAQYSNFVVKSRVTANPNRLFEDANGLLATLGWAIPYGVFLWVRAFAAIGALAMSALAKRRFPDPLGTLYVAGIAVAYLMLFNPRTQSNSYLIPASVAALLAARHALERRRLAAVAMCVVVVGWYGNSHHMQWPEYWLKPLACVGFAALLVWELAGKPTTPLPLAEPTRRRDRPPSRRTSRDRPREK